jgi:hypothetical protein
MQFRSALQHAWATAVETVGTFLSQSLKSSSGEQEWLRFFALMGSAIALREETALIPNTPADSRGLVAELRDLSQQLDVRARLTAYGDAMNEAEQNTINAHYFLLAVDPRDKRITITGFRSKDLERASREYLDVERDIQKRPGAEAVLVSVESVTALRRAYPNYFLDTKVFLDVVSKAIR